MVKRCACMMQFSNFEHAIIKSKALSILFDEYRYEDLLVAFFCVSIKRNNRSTLENCLSMNNALLEHSDKKCGIKPIVTYEEFTQFFESSCISVGKNRKLCTLTPCVT